MPEGAFFSRQNRDFVQTVAKDSALADLTAEADKGYNVRRFARTDGNTLNTPYKADLTSAANGFAIISMSSSNVGTIVWIPMGIPKIFIINKVSGTWGNWTSTVTNNDLQAGVVNVVATANGTTEFKVTFPKAFTSLPIIMTNVVTSRPDLRTSSPLTRSTTGFTGVLYNNSSAADISIFWMANGI